MWRVAEEDIENPIIGRRLLESIGCNNQSMLAAARDQYGEEINVKKRLCEDGNAKMIDSRNAALFGEFLFHSGGQVENDRLKTEHIYVESGDDSQEKIDAELALRVVQEARK